MTPNLFHSSRLAIRERAAHRVALPGQGVARRAVGHGEHQVGVAVEVLRRR